MTDQKPVESSVRVIASSSINYALVFALLSGLCAGVWFFATQTATNIAVAERQVRFEVAVGARLDASEKHEETRSIAMAAIDNRLSRMEAQLAFIVTNGARR